MTFLATMAILIFSSQSANAAFTVSNLGKINYGQIIRTVDRGHRKVCFLVQPESTGGSAISCVKRTQLDGTVGFSKVAKINYGEVKSIWDDKTQTHCVVVQPESTGGAAISCD